MSRKSGRTENDIPQPDLEAEGLSDLIEMAALWDLAHSPPDKLNENLSLFINLIESSRIPRDGIPIPSLSQVRPMPALFGIARWASLNPDLVTAKLKEHWPHIWGWSSCLLNVKFKDLKVLAHQACCCVVVSLGVDQEMRDIIASTPGTITALVKLWVAEVDSNNIGHPATPMSIPASRAVHMFLDPTQLKSYDKVMATLDEVKENVADIALGFVHRRIGNLSKFDISTLCADLAILYANRDVPYLRHDIFCDQGMQTIKNTMVRLLCCQGSECEGAAACLTYCVKYYAHGLITNHGRYWAYRTYDAPIIRAIIQASIWSQSEDRELGEALDKLTPYLVFRTVLRRAERALDLIQELDLKKVMKKGGRVYKAFRRYESLAGERLEIAEGRSRGTRICDNQPCSKIGQGKEFMRCSACLKAHYCSKECQRQAWKVGNHRDLCKLVKPCPDANDEGPECRILTEDYKFLRKVVLSDLKTHYLHITELKYKLLQSSPSLRAKAHLIAVIFDYTKPTLQVGLETDVVGTSLATWGDVDGHKALLTMVDRLESGAAGQILRAVLPYGKESFPCELFTL